MSRTLYSQGSAVLDTPIDSEGMWTTEAGGGGFLIPFNDITTDDILEANGRLNLINVSVTCNQIQTLSGGVFHVESTVTITANVQAGTTTCIATNAGGASYTVTINGNVTGGSAASACGILKDQNNCILIVNGCVTGGSYASNSTSTNHACGLYNTGTGAITISNGTSNCIVGGTGSAAYAMGIYNTAGNIINITGNVVGGSASGGNVNGFRNSGNATINITGNVTGGSSSGGASVGIYTIKSPAITITGNVTAGTSVFNNVGLQIATITSTILITGNIVNNTVTSAIYGSVRYNPGPENYIQYPDSAGTGTVKCYFDVPAKTNVLSSDTVAGENGTLILPETDEVLKDIVFGPDSILIGTLEVPVIDLPEVENVLESDTVGGIYGTLTLPLVEDVMEDVVFGPDSSLVGTYVNPLTITELSDTSKLPTYVLLSVAQHFKTYISNFDIFVEGTRKIKDGNWGELRVDGPTIDEHMRGQYTVPFLVSVLLSTIKNEKDIIAQEKNIETILKGFTRNIQIYTYGDETHTLVGCAKIISKIDITKYGNIDPTLNILQCVIEAKYELQLETT